MKPKNILDDYIAPALPTTLDTVSSVFVEGIAGTIIPGVGNLMIAYKQRQQEKRFELAIKELQDRQDKTDKILDKYNEDMVPQIRKMIEMYFDYCIQNNQEQKIELLANGYVNSIKIENPQEDVLLGFYDTILQINMLDIRVLKLYYDSIISDKKDSFIKIMQDYDIDYSQCNMIKEKLVRFGLLESKNDIKQDENIDSIIDYIQAVSKNKESDAKRALRKMKKVSRQDSYTITKYGRDFLQFFGNDEENNDIEII